MPVRLVEGQLPYTGGEAISIDENKVISLNLRDENNLIIYDQGDDEIYVDLQLPAGIKPNYAFPVGVTTGRVLVADDWDVTGTILVAKTTSGDVIKLLYGDDGTLWIDNGTGLFKQLYFKSDVDQIITTLTTYINTELAKKQNGVTSATAPTNPSQGDLWYDTVNDVLKVYDGSQWNTTGGGGSGDVQVSTDAGNLLTTGVKLWLGDKADFDNLGTLDSNTIYAPAIIKQIFYYDFRGKTGTNLTTDGWTLQTGSWNFDSNGIYNTPYSANDIHISIPATGFNFTRASKITVSFTGIFTNRSAAYIGICQSANAVNDMVGCTDINSGYGAWGVFSANDTSKTSKIAVTTGTYTETFEADVVNKTLKLSIPSYTDATGTILDADLGIVSSLSYFYVHIRGLGSKTTISDLTVIVE